MRQIAYFTPLFSFSDLYSYITILLHLWICYTTVKHDHLDFGRHISMINTDTPFQDENSQPLTIFSIGHSNQSIETLFALLLQHEIQLLVDVRSDPYYNYVTLFN